MSIQVGWLNPSVIHIKFRRGWNWDDLYAALEQADTFIGSVSHTVHVIIDVSGGGRLPSDFIRAAGDLFAQGEARTNEGQRVVVGANGMVRMAYGGLQRVYGHRLSDRPFLFASSLEDAHALLPTSGD